MDPARWRPLFPVTGEGTYLNGAAESPLNTPVRQRLEAYLDLAARAPHLKPSVRGQVRQRLSQLLGGDTEEYALVSSTGVGIGLAAAGFPWVPGDNVVLPADEHWNNTFPWLALKARGVEVRVVPLEPDARLDLDRLAGQVDARTRMVAVAAVRHTTGFRTDLRRLSQIVRSVGAWMVVDGIQAAGVVPLNVEADGIDILACAGFKWLLGLPGTGFLYVRRGLWESLHPTLPGMFSAEDDLADIRWHPNAQRYETGSVAYPLFHAWTAGLDLLLETGVDAIHAQILARTSQILEGLTEQGVEVISPVATEAERSAILSFTLGSAEANQALVARLAAERVWISLRGGRCRVSPSGFTTREDVDHFLQILGTV